MDDPKQALPGAPENEEEGLTFPGESGDADKAVIDDTRDGTNADQNEIERDDDAPLSDEQEPNTES